MGNLDKDLSEGDVIAVLSQWGELEDLHLVRDEATGESRGFAFAKYEDARSCVLAVDNFCGVPLCGRSLRVDHVENYRLPKHLAEKEEQQQSAVQAGHAYEEQELENEFSLQHGQDLFAPSKTTETKKEATAAKPLKKKKKESKKKEKTDDESRQAKKVRKEERRKRKEQKKAEREEERRRRRARKLIQGKNEDDENDKDARLKKPKKRKREKDSTNEQRKHRPRHESGSKEAF